MSSELKVNSIRDTSNNEAITISSGNVSFNNTISAGTLGDNVVMNSGSVVKTTSQNYNGTMVSNCNTTLTYNVNRTTSNTTELGALTHTTKIANPRITVWFSGQIGFQTYGTGVRGVWCSLFANDVWKTGIRTKIWSDAGYTDMFSCPLSYSETITASAGHSYVVKVRWNQAGDFTNNTGIGNTPRVGLGHSGYDNSDGHNAYIIIQESVA